MLYSVSVIISVNYGLRILTKSKDKTMKHFNMETGIFVMNTNHAASSKLVRRCQQQSMAAKEKKLTNCFYDSV